MIVDILTWALLAAALMQPTLDRALPALAFAVPAALNLVLLGDIDGLYYYHSAALVDLAVLEILRRLTTHSELTKRLANISVASIVLNIAGWPIWMLYLPPDGYNAAFAALYAYALFTLLRRSRRHGYGGNAMDHRGDIIRSDPHPCRRVTD